MAPGRPRTGTPPPGARELPTTIGSRAEAAAVQYLIEAGYSIVATNLRLGRYELDVVARLGRVIVVVEIRSRGEGAWTSAFGSLDPKKRERIRRASERLWRARYRHDASVDRLRIDAISVRFEQGESIVEHAIAAF